MKPANMDSETDPYAPPHSEESEADEIRGWRVVGETILARGGATLPKIDLLTGDRGPNLRRRRLSATPLTGFFGDHVWIFSEDHLANRIQRVCKVLEWAVLATIMVVYFSSASSRYHWLNEVAWVACWLLLAVLWTRDLTIRKLRIQTSVKQGWFRIAPIHPDAIAHLRGLKAAEPTDKRGGES